MNEKEILKNLELVSLALINEKQVDNIIEDVLDIVFSIFECDRIWLFYPCDPDAQTFQVLAEKNNPQYPGAFSTGQELPITPEAADTIRKTIDSGVPTVFDPESGNRIDDVASQFSVLSQIMMAVHPRSGKPWMFGMHQCSYARIWTKSEQALFKEISFRVVQTLSNLILLKDLKESEQKYRDLLENIPLKIFHKDVNSSYVSCNKNYAKDLNIEPHTISGTTDYDYFPKSLANKYINDDQRIIESGRAENIIERYLANEQEFWIQTIKTPLLDDDGRVSGILGAFQDITQSKKAEETIQAIFKTSVGYTGQDYFNNLCIQLCNLLHCECAIVGEFSDATTVKAIAMVLEGKHIDDFSYQLKGSPCENVSEQGYCYYPKDVTQLFPDDKELQNMQAVGYAGIPLKGKNGQAVGILCILSKKAMILPERSEDLMQILASRATLELERVNAQKEKATLEYHLRQSHKMEALGTLAGGIAHDFNNILAAILGYADLAMEDIPEQNQAKNYIEQVLKSGNRAKNLVRHILSFSQKEVLELYPVAIQHIVAEAFSFLRATIPTNVDIQTNIDPDCGMIRSDSNQIHQVLVNLCSNAAHAMEERGGNLTIDLKPIDISTFEQASELGLDPGPYIQLSVQDTGEGIEENIHDKIFDPYFTTKEVGKGSGMGLAVVVGIVKSHGGLITVKSNLGEGAIFTVYFPRIEEQVQEENKKTAPLPKGNEKILIVDDDETIVALTKRRVEKLGYQVTALTSSIEALELFRCQPDGFDLVITDQTMPMMTGEQFAKEMLVIRPDLPIIISTGYSARMDKEKANLLGIRAFIMKPVDKKELAMTINKILHN